MKRAVTLTALLLGATLMVGAQEPPSGAPTRGAQPRRSGRQMDDRREMIRLMVVSRMRDRLALSEAQTLKVMTLLEDMEKQQERHRAEIEPMAARLRALVDDPATTDVAFKEAVAAAEKLRQTHAKENQTREDELLAVFTPRQQAQWLVLRRELLRRLQGGGEGHGPGPNGRPDRIPDGPEPPPEPPE
jgi:Spy/CpxP family protein refolding chaperone